MLMLMFTLGWLSGTGTGLDGWVDCLTDWCLVWFGVSVENNWPMGNEITALF